ncbi:secreted protein, partial [sediment metagenome]
MLKTLSLCALVSLSLGTGMAQADNGSCLLGSVATPQAAAPQINNGDAGSAMLGQMEARMNQQLDRIEQGLRNGQISPMQAGKMMREQWEAM